MQHASEEILFNEELPFHLALGADNERQSRLRVLMTQCGGFQKLRMQITEESVPDFLFTSETLLSQFHKFKEQGVTAEMSGFAEYLIELFRKCMAPACDSNGDPKMKAKLNVGAGGEAKLCVVESTTAIEVRHIWIPFVAGGPQEVIALLSDKTRRLKEQLLRLTERSGDADKAAAGRIADLKEQLEHATKVAVECRQEMDAMLAKVSLETNQIKLEASREVARLQGEQAKEKAALDKQLSDEREMHRRTKEKLEEENKLLDRKRQELEKQVASLQHQLDNKGKLHDTVSDEIQALRQRKLELERENAEQASTLQKNAIDLSRLMQEVKDNSGVHTALVNEKASIEQLLAEVTKKREMVEAHLRESCNEILQANTALEQRTAKLVKQDEMLRKRKAKCALLQKRVSELEHEVMEHQRAEGETRHERDVAATKFRDLEGKLEDVKKELVEAHKEIARNKKLMEIQSQEMNKQSMFGPGGATPGLTFRSTGVISSNVASDYPLAQFTHDSSAATVLRSPVAGTGLSSIRPFNSYAGAAAITSTSAASGGGGGGGALSSLPVSSGFDASVARRAFGNTVTGGGNSTIFSSFANNYLPTATHTSTTTTTAVATQAAAMVTPPPPKPFFGRKVDGASVFGISPSSMAQVAAELGGAGAGNAENANFNIQGVTTGY